MPSAKLSPSVCHQLLVKQTKQSMSFDPSQDFATWRKKLRNKLKSLLGQMPDTRVPLKPRTLWSRQTALGTIEKNLFHQ